VTATIHRSDPHEALSYRRSVSSASKVRDSPDRGQRRAQFVPDGGENAYRSRSCAHAPGLGHRRLDSARTVYVVARPTASTSSAVTPAMLAQCAPARCDIHRGGPAMTVARRCDQRGDERIAAPVVCDQMPARKMRTAAAANASPARRSIERAARKPLRHAVRSSRQPEDEQRNAVAARSEARVEFGERRRFGADLSRGQICSRNRESCTPARQLRFIFELRAQPPHVHVDRALVTVEVETQTACSSAVREKATPGLLASCRQERELARFEAMSAPSTRTSRALVDFEPVEPQQHRRRIGRKPAAPGECAHARDHSRARTASSRNRRRRVRDRSRDRPHRCARHHHTAGRGLRAAGCARRRSRRRRASPRRESPDPCRPARPQRRWTIDRLRAAEALAREMMNEQFANRGVVFATTMRRTAYRG